MHSSFKGHATQSRMGGGITVDPRLCGETGNAGFAGSSMRIADVIFLIVAATWTAWLFNV